MIYSFKSLITLKQPSPKKRGHQIHLFIKSVNYVYMNMFKACSVACLPRKLIPYFENVMIVIIAKKIHSKS